MRAQSGFILITTFLMLSLLSLLLVTDLKMVSLYIKRAHLYQRAEATQMNLEAVARHLVPKLGSLAVIAGDSAGDAPTRDRVLQHGVPIAEHYRYLIRDLGVYPCVKLTGFKVPQSSRQWVLTLADESADSPMLQLRIATATADTLCPWDTISYYHEGVMTSRWVI